MTPIPKFHWSRDKVDKRDHIYQPRTLAVAPTKVDLRANCSAIENQGQLGSCTGNAIAGVIEFLYKRAKKNIDVSRLFIYYNERMIEGTTNYDNGAFLRDGIKAVNYYGAPMESLWPYNVAKFAYRPTRDAYVDGAKRKAVAYQRCANFAAVKNALAIGYPVVVGFDVYESYNTLEVARTGMMPYPNKQTEQLLGGHAVALVGYDDATQRFIGRNSWGVNWGDRGYFYMPYQVIQDTTMSSDFWIITTVTG